MDETTPFVIETVIVLFFSVIVQGFCIRQLFYDISASEKWRPLIVCHWLTEVASLLQVVGNVDPQGGLGVYSQAFITFCGQVRSMFLISSAQALAVGFLESYQIITQGSKPHPARNLILITVHVIFITVAFGIFLTQMITRSASVGIAAKFFVSLYSLVVGGQVVVSALRVRKILVDEHKRVDKYSDAIYKLTRLIFLVTVLVGVGNGTLYVGLTKIFEMAKTTNVLPDEKHAFETFHIFSDFSGLAALTALITGSWKVQSKKGGGSKRSTRGSTLVSSRKSTAKLPSRELAPEEATSELSPPSPPTVALVPPILTEAQHRELASYDSPVKVEERKLWPVGTNAEQDQPADEEDNSSKRRRKQGYQDLV
jgi:hypothetical protein